MKKALAFLALLAICLHLGMRAGLAERVQTWLETQLVDPSTGAEPSPEGTEPPASAVPTDAMPSQPQGAPLAQSQPPKPTAAVTPLPMTLGDEPEILPTTIAGGLTIRNDTSYDPDLARLLTEGMALQLPRQGVQVLIVHTHGSEAYTPDAQDQYVSSDSARTEDKNYNVIRVGDELAALLESYGLTVVHDREIYDYPSYTGSYSRSAEAVAAHLEQHPETALVIDLHRDALGTEDVIYKTVAALDGETSSQLMLVVGTGENGLEHPLWEENLKLALRMQAAVHARYPTLARPILLARERYNQHLTTGSLILEVGSSGNTLQEALSAVRLFANAVGPALADMVERPEPLPSA